MAIRMEGDPCQVSVDGTEIQTVGFKEYLDSGELVASALAVEQETSDLTLTTPVVNTSAITIKGVSNAIGQAVQFYVSGGARGHRYRILVTGTTDSSPTARVVPREMFVKFV